MGSKSRYAKYLLPIILDERKDNQWYVEPFVGGANIIDKVNGKRAGVDNNFYLIEMWKALQNGWIPPKEISEQEYKEIKDNKENFLPHLVGYVGFNLSYAGKWWGGYARDKAGKRNYGREAFNNVIKQISGIKDILFLYGDYQDLVFTDSSIIYCDPPYNGTTKYNKEFNYEKFYNWCRLQSNEGHRVFISEYNMPEDFTCVWSKQVNNTLVQNTGSKQGTERLFICNV